MVLYGYGKTDALHERLGFIDLRLEVGVAALLWLAVASVEVPADVRRAAARYLGTSGAQASLYSHGPM